MQLPSPASLEPLSFFFGFVIATIFWWVILRARPLLKDLGENMKKGREEAQARRSGTLEENHRRVTLRRAQGMHLAAPLFALNEIIQEPRLLAPPPRVEPGGLVASEDVVSMTVPYLPAWPELGAVFGAATLSLGEALSGGMNLVLIGQPGVGKTVALAHLATLAANRSEELGTLKDAIPFLLHVADLKLPVAEAKEMVDRVVEIASEHASVLDLGRVPGFVQGAFRSGRALLLIDGYDELTAEGQRDAAAGLRLLLAEYPKLRVVTTGVPEYMDGLLALRFAPLAVAGWNRERQAAFMQRWGVLWAHFVAVEAWAQTGAQVDPLLLNCWLSSDNQFLTPLELTLKVWGAYAGDMRGPGTREVIASHILRLSPGNTPLAALETLAMQVTLACQPVFDPRQARQWVKAFELPEEAAAPAEEAKPEEPAAEPEPKDEKPGAARKERRRGRNIPAPTPGLLGRLAASGLVIAHAGNRMRFAHPIFGGYLAGRALSAYNAEETLLNQTDWTGKLLAMRYMASFGDATAVVKRLLDWSRLPMHRPMLAAARWLRDGPRNAAWRAKVMGALADLLQSEGLPMCLRGQALAAFAVSGDPGVAALFRQFGNTLSFELMRLVALGMGAVGDTKAVRALEGMLQAPSISVRRAACLALTAIGTADALEIVARALLTGDEDLRRAAAEALANDTREGHPVLKDGAGMTDILLRRAVIYGLARVREPWAQEILQKMRLEDEQWVIRNSASEVIEAMSTAGNPHIPRPLKPPSETPWLIEFAGTKGVGISPGAPATELLLAALKSPKEDERLGALAHLRQRPTDGIIKELYGAMYADDVELREAAYITLWEIGASGYKLPHPTQFGFS